MIELSRLESLLISDNSEPSLVGNNLEGVTTRTEPKSNVGYGNNVHPSGAILSGSAGHPSDIYRGW